MPVRGLKGFNPYDPKDYYELDSDDLSEFVELGKTFLCKDQQYFPRFYANKDVVDMDTYTSRNGYIRVNKDVHKRYNKNLFGGVITSIGRFAYIHKHRKGDNLYMLEVLHFPGTLKIFIEYTLKEIIKTALYDDGKKESFIYKIPDGDM